MACSGVSSLSHVPASASYNRAMTCSSAAMSALSSLRDSFIDQPSCRANPVGEGGRVGDVAHIYHPVRRGVFDGLPDWKIVGHPQSLNRHVHIRVDPESIFARDRAEEEDPLHTGKTGDDVKNSFGHGARGGLHARHARARGGPAGCG